MVAAAFAALALSRELSPLIGRRSRSSLGGALVLLRADARRALALARLERRRGTRSRSLVFAWTLARRDPRRAARRRRALPLLPARQQAVEPQSLARLPAGLRRLVPDAGRRRRAQQRSRLRRLLPRLRRVRDLDAHALPSAPRDGGELPPQALRRRRRARRGRAHLELAPHRRRQLPRRHLARLARRLPLRRRSSSSSSRASASASSPRTSGAASLTVGFSDRVDLDDYGRIKDNPQVIMRVEFPSGAAARRSRCICAASPSTTTSTAAGRAPSRSRAVAAAAAGAAPCIGITRRRAPHRPEGARAPQPRASSSASTSSRSTPRSCSAPSTPVAFELPSERAGGPAPLLEPRGADELYARRAPHRSATARTTSSSSARAACATPSTPTSAPPDARVLDHGATTSTPTTRSWRPTCVVPADLPPRIRRAGAARSRKRASGPWHKARRASSDYLRDATATRSTSSATSATSRSKTSSSCRRPATASTSRRRWRVMLRTVGVPTRSVNGFLRRRVERVRPLPRGAPGRRALLGRGLDRRRRLGHVRSDARRRGRASTRRRAEHACASCSTTSSSPGSSTSSSTISASRSSSSRAHSGAGRSSHQADALGPLRWLRTHEARPRHLASSSSSVASHCFRRRARAARPVASVAAPPRARLSAARSKRARASRLPRAAPAETGRELPRAYAAATTPRPAVRRARRALLRCALRRRRGPHGAARRPGPRRHKAGFGVPARLTTRHTAQYLL